MSNLSFVPLFSETGTFSISNSGSGYWGFFFQGDESFIERCINLCVNYGMLQFGKIHSYGDTSKYILVPPERLKKGLKEYFKGELLGEGAVKKVFSTNEDGETYDVNWDESLLDKLAQERADQFLVEKVSYQDLLSYEGGYYPHAEYSFGQICAEKE